jgi:radical SAM protein with 4Fe4S-binding SPASM domain
MPKPYYRVNIEISNICNLQCSFCPEVIRTKALMEPSLFRKIISEVSHVTKVVSLHLMGDPLVHPKLKEIVAICDEFSVKIFLVTNGILLGDKETEILLHPAFRQVNFSLHSFADNFPGGNPTRYLNRIFDYTEKAFDLFPLLFINYRLWNLRDPRAGTAKNQDLLNKIAERFDVTLPTEWDTGIQKNLVVKKRLSLHFDTEFVWPGSSLPIIGDVGTCYGLSSHFGILVDGTVVPCCLDKEGAIPLGNIKDSALDAILKGPRAQKIRAGFRENRLVEDLCRRCQYIERFS